MTYTDIEGPIHRAILAHLRGAYPGAVVHHSANELPLKGKDVARAIAKAKRNGMVSGYPDLVMHWRGRTFGFEVKAPKGTVSDNQAAVMAAMDAQGVPCAVVRSVADVEAFMALQAFNVPLRGVVS